VPLPHFDKCTRFHGYTEGALIRHLPELFYNTSMPKAVVRKATETEIENAQKVRKKAAP
jgi:stachyose synthetase